MALVWAGGKFQIGWLRQADPIAALFVACVVVNVSWRLARRTMDTLLDAAPAGVRNQILDRIATVDGVLEVERVRIRKSGNRYFADVSLGLARNFTFQRSEQVSDTVTSRVREILPDADVMVHSVPRAHHSENIFDRIRAVATRHNFNVHDISVQDLAGELHVEQHLELDEQLSMKQAHDEVTRLEAEMRAEIPEIATILTHIESEPATIENGRADRARAGIRKTPAGCSEAFSGSDGCARISVQEDSRPAVCLLPLHTARRYAALARARCADGARNPVQAGRAGVVSSPHHILSR